MAIVLDTSPAGAIAAYADLVAEVRDLQDNEAYDSDVIDRAIRKAESYFLRKLRLGDMEVSETLAVTDATASLPTSCRELRAVIWQGSGCEYPLDQMSLSDLASAYGGVGASYPYGYAREGLTLRFGPVADGTARIVYYADLEPLSEANPANWMLSKAPDLYIAGVQYYLCRRERDDTGAQLALRELDGIITSLQEEAARHAGGNLIPHGIRQVCGARV